MKYSWTFFYTIDSSLRSAVGIKIAVQADGVSRLCACDVATRGRGLRHAEPYKDWPSRATSFRKGRFLDQVFLESTISLYFFCFLSTSKEMWALIFLFQ